MTEEQTPQLDAQKPDLPENDVQVEDAGTLKKKVTVTIPRASIDAKYNEMYGELRTSAQIPGFRIGRAPRRLIEKRFGKEVSQDVRNSLIGESIGDAVEKSELETLGEPDLDLEAVEVPEEGDMSFSFEVEVMPEFELPETKGIEVNREVFDVDSDKIDEYIQNIREGQARYEKTDEASADGDGILASVHITGEDIDYQNPRIRLRVAAGVIEGVPMVDLGKDLLGKKTGDTVELTATAPETHTNEDWQGKELKISLEIHEVERRIVPEMNEEFATECGFDNVEEFREYVATQLKARVEQETQRAMRDQITEYLVGKAEFDLPEGVVAQHTQRVLQRQLLNLLQMGMPREKIDENLARMQAAADEQARRDLKLQFMMNKIAEAEDVEVSEGEVNSRIAMMAAQYGRRPERMRQELAADGSLDQLAMNLRDEKTIDKLLEQAKISDVKPEDKPAEKAEKKAAKKSEKKATKKASKKSARKSDKKDEASED